MTARFSDLIKVGTKGPYNFSKMKFKVFIDVDGGYHLRSHKDLQHTTPRTHTTKTSSRTFAQIADCCARATRWEDAQCYQRISAQELLKVRANLMAKGDSIREREKIAPDKLTSAEVYNLIVALTTERDYARITLRDVRFSPMIEESWLSEYGAIQLAEIKRLTELFKELDPGPFAETFVESAMEILPVPTGINPAVAEVLVSAQERMRKLFADPRSNVLGALGPIPAGLRISDRVLLNLYEVKGTNTVILPAAIAQHLERRKLLSASTSLKTDVNMKTLEALSVLYAPDSSGPYSNLDTALEAARVL